MSRAVGYHDNHGDYWTSGGIIDPDQGIQQMPWFKCTLEGCSESFQSHQDLRVHSWSDHKAKQPFLILQGREIRQYTLKITAKTAPPDWVFSNTQEISFNEKLVSSSEAQKLLVAKQDAKVELILTNRGVSQKYEISFKLAELKDLNGVDQAFDETLGGKNIGPAEISTFRNRANEFPSASEYAQGLINFLQGIVAKEEALDGSNNSGRTHYELLFTSAASKLKDYDRELAELVCMSVDFYFNNFEESARRTRSGEIADVAAWFRELKHHRFDELTPVIIKKKKALSRIVDSCTLEIFELAENKFDGSVSTEFIETILQKSKNYDKNDKDKVHMVCSELYFALGNYETALRVASRIQHRVHFQAWYTNFKVRLENTWKTK